MKERPILFSGPMVRALLDGSKTQTRRVVKPQPTSDAAIGARWIDINGQHQWAWVTGEDEDIIPSEKKFTCPYGKPGDRLWVRETARCISRGGNGLSGERQTPVVCVEYAAGGSACFDTFGGWFPKNSLKKGMSKPRWTPSIHMPRWAIRILLEVTDVRVERLQDISEADANAEGVRHSLHLPGGRFARGNYEHLWWTIHGDDSWEANHWVWVIEFKRVEPT